MKFKTFLLIIAALVTCSCKTDLHDSGISKELATLRKANINDLEYSLVFSIPEKKDSAISGHIDVGFRLERPMEIVMDFREQENIENILVNGEKVRYELKNEHVIIPAKAFQKGENTVASLSPQATNRLTEATNSYIPCLFRTGHAPYFHVSTSLT